MEQVYQFAGGQSAEVGVQLLIIIERGCNCQYRNVMIHRRTRDWKGKRQIMVQQPMNL